VTLLPILVLTGLGVGIGLVRNGRFRRASLLLVSVAAVYFLQPATPLRSASFWLPTLGLLLTVLVGLIVRPRQAPWKATLLTCAALAVIVMGIAAVQSLPLGLGPPLLPPWAGIGAAIGVTGVVAAILFLRPGAKSWLGVGWVLLILAVFVVLKSEPLSTAASAGLRRLAGQSPELAAPIDLTWLGFSYLAFRLLHVLLDRRAGRLPEASLAEIVTYALFFPALSAGPIDRLERFVGDLRRAPALTPESAREGGKRILLGLVKKFVIADSLAMIALQPLSAERVTAGGWLWVLLYAFSFQLYFDFSGYTDVAVGTATLVGIRLPENFRRPYVQPNLTAFWNRWHITLADWFRAYVFNPLTRALRGLPHPWPAAAVIFVGQVTTMVLLGLWHGIGWGFVIWGAWHGLGLFLQNRWSAWTRPAAARLVTRPMAQRALAAAGTLLTFHFVTLGWVWFTLPDTAQAVRVMGRLFGG
jgi:D-alanyl-lipoteichoic acid acyltransferase DltB (MBOAT superfamily)